MSALVHRVSMEALATKRSLVNILANALQARLVHLVKLMLTNVYPCRVRMVATALSQVSVHPQSLRTVFAVLYQWCRAGAPAFHGKILGLMNTFAIALLALKARIVP